MTLHAHPGRGRICGITFTRAGRTVVLPPTLVAHEPGPFGDDRRVDLVLPHAGRAYATGAVVTFTDAGAARLLAAAATRAAEMLENNESGTETVDEPQAAAV